MHIPSNASASISLSNFGGLNSGTGPNSLPEGASPRNNDVDYIIGDVITRPHLASVYSYANSALGPNSGGLATSASATGKAWSNPSGILIEDGAFAYVGQAAGNSIVGGSDPLLVTQFAFNLPTSASVTGISILLSSYASTTATVTLQLLKAGVKTGTAKTLAMNQTGNPLIFGGPTDSWGALLGYADVNSTMFGVQVTVASTMALASAFCNFIQITVYESAQGTNFNFVGTYQTQNGSILNLSLDANGNLWVENATTNPNVLSLALQGITPGSYAKGVATQNAYFMAFSNLFTGSDIPRQYTQNWIDRVSQVGPGAPPVFTATTTTGTTPATIASYSITSNIVTFTAANAFVAGEVVTISGLSTATGLLLNGNVFNVLGVGLSGTQFEVAFQAANQAATTDAGQAVAQYTYPIQASPQGITQPAQVVRSFAGLLWSAGPGNQTPGNTITVYYSDSTTDVPDATLVNLFNSGQPVYVFITGSPIGNGTWQITSVGIGTQPQEARQDYYFTFQVPQTEYANYRGQSGYGVKYQVTAATLTTVVPIPGLQVGQQFTISGAGVSQWNNQWSVSQALNASSMAITQTAMTSGVATYSYATTQGSANPIAGELVTITNTLNGNGIFNVIDVPIASVSGTSLGTFTVAGFPLTSSFAAQTESGQATTAGTQFQFDPGITTLGTQNSPIFGNSGGGVVSLAGVGQVVGSGTRQGVVFFITRNGYETTPSPPVTFTTLNSSNYIQAANIPVGPPNVIARAIAFTEAGQNGVPGGNFFTIPQQEQFTVNGVTYVSSSLIINDNVTTSAKFTFSDNVLLSATAIDVQGNNLFNLIEIGSPAWIVSYASRMFYGGCQNKIQNFLNLSFDGGYIPSTRLSPLGWSTDPLYGLYGSLLTSPIFGNSYYIQNQGQPEGVLGMITQPATQDAYSVPIININTTYSVRVTARAPSGKTGGTLMVDLTQQNIGSGYGAVYGSFALPFASLTTTFQTFSGTLLTQAFGTVPSGLLLRLWASNLVANADVEIDRIEIFPTLIPVLSTQVFASYVGSFESVDAVTGVLGVASENQQAVTGGSVLDDILYLEKTQSQYEVQDTPNTEPAYWNDARDVSQKAGACGPNAYDQGEGWIASASRPGIYVFVGGQPKKISHEIYQIWDAINWAAGETIWLRNDVTDRKLYVGVPLPTPNFWLPLAPVNAAPTTPNVILMLNYQGVDSGEELQQAMGLHATMFGNLMNPDMRRKWSIWQIPCPYADFVSTEALNASLYLCNGIQSSKIYVLTPNQDGVVPTDDGAPINWLYTTYGWNGDKIQQNPLLGPHRKTWEYMVLVAEGVGNMACRLLPETILAPGQSTAGYYPGTVANGFTLTSPALQDHEAPLNFQCRRVYLEFSGSGLMDLSEVVMVGRKNVWNSVRGIR